MTQDTDINPEDKVFFFLAPEVEDFLIENDIGVRQILQKSGLATVAQLGENPASNSAGEKEPATILLASAAVIAAATPILRELIRNISGREAVVREQHLVPVEDSKGKLVRDAEGAPILHWVDVSKGQAPDQSPQAIKIKGFGIEISFGGK